MIFIDMKKICTVCTQEKDLDEFHKSKLSKDGFRGDCKNCRSIERREYNKKNKEKNKEYKKEYYERNKDIIKQYNDEWSKKNPKYQGIYHKERMKNDPIFHISQKLRARLRDYLKKNEISKKNKTFVIIGCSPENLKKYLEEKFYEGMSWDNRNLWDIDHIIPLSSSKTIEDVEKLSHYTNLQPMWRIENLKKGCKIL
jgi:hypothetical protein